MQPQTKQDSSGKTSKMYLAGEIPQNLHISKFKAKLLNTSSTLSKKRW